MIFLSSFSLFYRSNLRTYFPSVIVFIHFSFSILMITSISIVGFLRHLSSLSSYEFIGIIIGKYKPSLILTLQFQCGTILELDLICIHLISLIVFTLSVLRLHIKFIFSSILYPFMPLSIT